MLRSRYAFLNSKRYLPHFQSIPLPKRAKVNYPIHKEYYQRVNLPELSEGPWKGSFNFCLLFGGPSWWSAMFDTSKTKLFHQTIFIKIHVFIQRTIKNIKYFKYFGPIDGNFLHLTRHISMKSDVKFWKQISRPKPGCGPIPSSFVSPSLKEMQLEAISNKDFHIH